MNIFDKNVSEKSIWSKYKHVTIELLKLIQILWEKRTYEKRILCQIIKRGVDEVFNISIGIERNSYSGLNLTICEAKYGKKPRDIPYFIK